MLMSHLRWLGMGKKKLLTGKPAVKIKRRLRHEMLKRSAGGSHEGIF